MTDDAANTNSEEMQPEERETPRKSAPTKTKSGASPNPKYKWGDPNWPLEARELWPLMLAWIVEQAPPRNEPKEIGIQIKRPVPGMKPQYQPAFDGSYVTGDQEKGPGEALEEFITEKYHLGIAQGPVTYSVRFFWRHGGETIRVADLDLDDPKILSRIKDNLRRESVEVPDEPYDPPPAPTQAAAPATRRPPYYGAPPAPQTVADPRAAAELIELRATVARLQDALGLDAKLDEALRQRDAATPAAPTPPAPPPAAPPPPERVFEVDPRCICVTGHRGGPHHPGCPAAPPPPVTAETIAEIVDKVLERRLGIGAPQAAPSAAPAPPPPAPPPPAPDPLRAKFQGVMDNIFDTAFNTVAENIKKGVKAAVAGEPVAEGVAEPMPEEETGLPWVGADTDAKWPDGRPVRFARSKDSGNWSVMGAVHENPIVMEKAGAMVGGILESISNGIQKAIEGGIAGPHVVTRRAPGAAVGAGQSQQQQQQGAPPANGSGGGSWPKST